MPPLFHDLRFYLSRSLSPDEKAELTQLIESNGGVVVSASSTGATQLVNYETLHAKHPEWIATDFIKHSIALQSLQNPLQYSGSIYTIEKHNQETKRQGRRKYTVLDEARMLHFVKLRGWRSMEPIAQSVWRRAEQEKVTFHSAPSMHEHFRKKLQRKTPMEQRSIMAKAAELTRMWMLEQETAAQEEKVTEERRSHFNSTGFQNVATQESMPSTHASRQTVITASHTSRPTMHNAPQCEVRGEEKVSQRDVRTRSRKPTSPLKIFHSVRKSEALSRDITSPALAASPERLQLAMSVDPAAPQVSIAQATPSGSETDDDQSAGRKQQKRKRISTSSKTAVSGESSLLRQGTEGSDVDSVESKTSRDNGVYFHSTWTELARDYAKRRKLQRFFEPSFVPASEAQASSIGPAVTHPVDVGVFRAAQVGECSQQMKTVELFATDKDTDRIICELQFKTHQDMLTVVHALYYCSGDAKAAEDFLKGAMPLSMWSPEDDLLLANLVAEDGISRPAVDTAVARGDFVSMRVPRDTDAILKRVRFLR